MSRGVDLFKIVDFFGRWTYEDVDRAYLVFFSSRTTTTLWADVPLLLEVPFLNILNEGNVGSTSEKSDGILERFTKAAA